MNLPLPSLMCYQLGFPDWAFLTGFFFFFSSFLPFFFIKLFFILQAMFHNTSCGVLITVLKPVLIFRFQPTESLTNTEPSESQEKIEPESSKRKRPNIISHGSKFGRKRSSATSQFDQTVDQIEGTKKDGTIRCRFCGKKYQHIKARNKHLISDHFEECRQVLF